MTTNHRIQDHLDNLPPGGSAAGVQGTPENQAYWDGVTYAPNHQPAAMPAPDVDPGWTSGRVEITPWLDALDRLGYGQRRAIGGLTLDHERIGADYLRLSAEGQA